MSATVSVAIPPPLGGRAGAVAAALGPFAAGACLAAPGGPLLMAKIGAAMLLITAGVAALMLPALYIASAFVGAGGSARQLIHAAASALVDSGALLLGLAPALLFLVTTSTSELAAVLLFHAALGLATVIALRGLYARAFGGSAGALLAVPLFVLWSLVGVGLAEHLVFQLLESPLQ